jgi:predicted DNA-binding transcriptional regulator YafY
LYHPTTRLLTILELLQTQGQMSSSQLAARLEVDARTVRRYVLMLQDLGIPIEAEMGRLGGYSLRPGFKLPPMMFTNEEALALMLGLLAARQIGLTTESWSVEGAFAKLQRVLPEPLRDQTQALQNVLVFAFPPPEQRVETALVTMLSEAVHLHQQVIIAYRRGDEESERIVDPYGVVCYEGKWYLIGYCHLREGTRVFRFDRIVRASPEPTHFMPPANFDSLAYLIESFQVIPDRWTVEVLLKAPLEAVTKEIPISLGLLQPREDGVLLHTEVSELDWLARRLVGIGFPLVVFEPPELRDAFERLAAQVVQFAHAPA